jgi:3-hydroxybutyryl-CoA dehydratase
MAEAVREYLFSQLHVGLSCSFEAVLRAEICAQYVQITGDASPLHIDADFARSQGFSGAVVHGCLVASFYSTLVGVHLPGRYALLLKLDATFNSPAYTDDRLLVEGKIAELNASTSVCEVAARIHNQHNQLVSRARILVRLQR